jgi:hypothetical protein
VFSIFCRRRGRKEKKEREEGKRRRKEKKEREELFVEVCERICDLFLFGRGLSEMTYTEDSIFLGCQLTVRIVVSSV